MGVEAMKRMGEDESSIPRRLRRFYRKGEPIPTDTQNHLEREKPHGEEVLDNEPWMNAHQSPTPTSPASKNQRHVRNRESRAPSPVVQPPRFEKVLEQTQKPPVTTMDHALGLSEKSKFEERLPQQGDKAMQDHSGKQEEIEHTLRELKELASLGNAKDSKQGPASFHFTPAGGAPTPPSQMEKAIGNTPPSIPSSQLSPRERMEQRRQGKGMPPEENGNASPSPPSKPSQPSSTNPSSDSRGGSDHYRRRLGQLERPGENKEEEPTPTRSPSPASEEDMNGDLKDFFTENKKKKTKKSTEEDDLSLDDMPLFEDEK
jgi:hypothetical protein